MKNIVLLGMPGSGKSTLGAALAQRLGKPFIDLDRYIEQQAGRDIPTIFAQEGEEAFRRLEALAVEQHAGLQGTIIATGGGVVLRPSNIALLEQNGLLVFLDRPPEQIAGDLQVAHRPLLQQGPQALFNLYSQRLPLYRQYADCILLNNHTSDHLLNSLVVIAGAARRKAVFAVIGQPIAHSLSPAIHLPVLQRFFAGVQYRVEEVTPPALAAWVAKARQEGLDGFNVTMPHKQSILPMLDWLQPQARAEQTVNTVARCQERLLGYTTDADGFCRSLAEKDVSLTASHIVLLGTGGAASTLAHKAGRLGAAALTVLARSPEKAQALAEEVGHASPALQPAWGDMENASLAKACKNADILINATPLGMQGTPAQFEDFSFLQALPAHALVCDLIYKPAETLLLQQAAAQGLATLGGLGMLLYQALLADEYYLGFAPNAVKMQGLALASLAQRL